MTDCELVSAYVGVRQGSPTSRILFALFVNEIIRMVNAFCTDDGLIVWLHVLLFFGRHCLPGYVQGEN